MLFSCLVDKLGYLRTLSRTCLTTYNRNDVVLNIFHDLSLMINDGQLRSFILIKTSNLRCFLFESIIIFFTFVCLRHCVSFFRLEVFKVSCINELKPWVSNRLNELLGFGLRSSNFLVGVHLFDLVYIVIRLTRHLGLLHFCDQGLRLIRRLLFWFTAFIFYDFSTGGPRPIFSLLVASDVFLQFSKMFTRIQLNWILWQLFSLTLKLIENLLQLSLLSFLVGQLLHLFLFSLLLRFAST